MNEYLQQAQDFLAKTNATMQIDFVGFASNINWKESTPRAMYQFKLTTPKGSMTDTFWDSINNTAIQQETIQSYAEKLYKTPFADLTAAQKTRAHKKLRKMKTEARPNAYDILAAVEKSDPGTFDDFCSEFGYNTDSRAAVRTYFAAQKEYADLARIFTAEQLEMLAEIN